MNMAVINSFLRKTGQAVVKNAPHLLMGIGTVSSVSAVIFAAQATPAAKDAYYKAKYSKGIDGGVEYECVDSVKLTIPETVKACGKYYIPAVSMEVLSLFCFWAAHGIDIRRQAVLSGLCATAQEALRDYQQKVKELIGDKAEKEVRNAVAQDKVDSLPPPQNVVVMAEDTNLWCIIDGQYFLSNYLKIKSAENDANHEMIQHMYLSQTDLYFLLDPERKYLKPTENSGQIGWNVDEMLVLDVDTAFGPDHKPILSINYRTKDGYSYLPKPGYSRML